MARKLLFSLALCLLLSGCSTVADHAATPSPVSSSDATAALPTASVRPAPEWGEQVYMTAYVADGRDEPVFAPEYRLPEIKNAAGDPAYEAINTFYSGALSDLAASAAEVSGWAVDDYKTAQAAGYPFQKYVDTESYELTLNTASRVSILRSHYSNSGGPAPTLYPIGDSFDLTTGTRLSFADLFSCPAEEAQSKVLDLVLGLNAQGAYAGTVLDAELLRNAYAPEHFYLTEDSLVCYFPDGDLPHALGSPTFAVPYTQLKEMMHPWE
ncbi:MAG: DUF3298 domain-containing protein [Pseudoflavonifractor sp.]|nr:DUF3298 domain-containing protein [Pseudoflavonifractor sp.]